MCYKGIVIKELHCSLSNFFTVNLEVVLLTNDNNLINKALVCGVDAYNRRVSFTFSTWARLFLLVDLGEFFSD